MPERTPIGHVIATVKMALYAGDDCDRTSWDWFIFEEPAVTDSDILGDKVLGVARRGCKTLEACVELEKPHA